MPYLKESEQRTFITDTLVLMRSNAGKLAEKGFNPTDIVAELEQLLDEAQKAEAGQTQARVALKEATRRSQESLSVAYIKSSSAVTLVSGVLGKKHPLVHQFRKLRRW